MKILSLVFIIGLRFGNERFEKLCFSGHVGLKLEGLALLYLEKPMKTFKIIEEIEGVRF